MSHTDKHKEEIIERLETFRLHLGITLNAFANRIGLFHSSLHNYVHHKRGLALDPIIKTLYAFPELSPDWLLLGRGEMLRGDTQAGVVIEAIQELQDAINATDVKLSSIKTRLTQQ